MPINRTISTLRQGDISTLLFKGSTNTFLITNLSSFRTSSNVAWAIVKPATRSNHRIGHAIDMNVVYDNKKQFVNSNLLARYLEVPNPVRRFIKFIIDDPDLRWKGNFTDRDPVHIDEHLNQDLGRWDHRYLAMQRAVQLGGVI